MIQNIMELNWTKFNEMDMTKVAVLVGFAPIEEHGKHLPLGVDVYETQYWMDQSILALEEEFIDLTFLTMPVIPYGHAVMKGFPGNIHLSQELFYNLVLSTLNNIVEWGVKHIIILSGHADPKHTIAIEQACDKIEEESGVIAFAPMGAIFSGKVPSTIESAFVHKKLEQYPHDYHAGWIETSNMLAIRHDLVNYNYKDQPNIELMNQDMINPKLVASKIKGYGHIGYPSEATLELGKSLNASTIEQIFLSTTAYLKREDYQQYAHHQLYEIPALRVREENKYV